MLGSAFEEVLKATFLDQIIDAFIGLLFEGVKVEAETSREESRLLGDHSDLLTQVLQVNLANVDSIDLDVSPGELDDASQRHAESRFAGTGTSHDSDFVPRLDLEGESVQHSLGVGAVLEHNIIELELSFGRPVGRRLHSALLDLLGNILEIEDTLSLHNQSHEPVEAAEEVHEPAHVNRPAKENGKGNLVRHKPLLGDDDE